MNQLMVGLGSLGLIGLIVWWFFGKPKSTITNAETTATGQMVRITVSGGYMPNRIQLKRGVPAKLIFTRQDTSSCFDEVVLPDFGIKTKLPVGQAFEVTVDPAKPGNFKYSCGMNMFHGEIIVK